MLNSVTSYGYYANIIKQLDKAFPAYESQTNSLFNSVVAARYMPQIVKDTLNSFNSYMKIATKGLNALANAASFDESSLLTATKASEPSENSIAIGFSTMEVASDQLDQSDFLNPGALDFQSDVSALTFNQGDETTDIEVDLTQADTNEDALRTIAREVNKTGSFKAKLVYADEGIRLQLSSTAKGKSSEFEVTGTFTKPLNLNRLAGASNTRITYLGDEYTSDTNKVQLEIAGEGVEISLTEEDIGFNRYEITLKEEVLERTKNLIERSRDSLQLFEKNRSLQINKSVKALSMDLQRISSASGNPNEDRVQLEDRSIERLSKETPLDLSRSIKALKSSAISFAKTSEPELARLAIEQITRDSAKTPDYAGNQYRMSVQSGTLFDLIL
ncbi:MULTISPECIES: hypothetical protein [unclassified Fusibacter]|uniref:hypothetical protein n=1 Tax=unclassified Fusibacter TaxID=2624464 RepID=UPI001011E0B5|nr:MULTISPECIES: hypothetical protein [unclassified Fusibacter]MCK8059290.1 hypothetical protein [Fusibacter sp. A2]NPE21246.1 hypothetical protein [Fusibacter sp. A1]RXV62511.1 hypothetical protein DWB64_05370 [Fusibacter sp. A1]